MKYFYSSDDRARFRRDLIPNIENIDPSELDGLAAAIKSVDELFTKLVIRANTPGVSRSDYIYAWLNDNGEHMSVVQGDDASTPAAYRAVTRRICIPLNQLKRGKFEDTLPDEDAPDYITGILSGLTEKYITEGMELEFVHTVVGNSYRVALKPTTANATSSMWARNLEWAVAYLDPTNNDSLSGSFPTFTVVDDVVTEWEDAASQASVQLDGYPTLDQLTSESWVDSLIHGVIDNIDERLQAARTQYIAEWRSRRQTERATIAEPPRKSREEKQTSLDAFRRKRKAALESTFEGELIPTLPFLDHGYASSRSWGIEVESGGARGVAAPSGWQRKRDGSLSSAWEGWSDPNAEDREVVDVRVVRPDNCTVGDHVPYTEIYDDELDTYVNVLNEEYVPYQDCDGCGRITTTRVVRGGEVQHGQSDDCAEFVSPILRSVHSKGLKAIVDELVKQPQNDTAGVHVHVGADGLTPKQIGSLIYGYDAIEGLIESSYRREEREYCKLRRTHEILDIYGAAKSKESVHDIPRGDRYTTVNLCSLDAHGTIEFRAMGPVYDYDHLVRWAMFCREMVNLAAAGVTMREWNSIKKWSDLTALFAKYGKEYIRAAMFENGMTPPSAPKLERDPNISMPGRDEETSTEAVDATPVDMADWEKELLALFEERESQLVLANTNDEV